MLRELKVGDADQLPSMMRRNFPEEETILGTDPEAVPRIARRFQRWDARVVLGLFRLFRRPIFRLFVIEADGRIAGTTLLTFAARSAYVSLVMVDAPFRRRGYARQLLEAARKGAASAGRAFVSLDVLEHNDSARRLYESIGYRPLRSQAFFVRPLTPGDPAVDPGPVPGIRPVRRSDEARLAEILNDSMAPPVRAVLPVRPQDFRVPAVVARAMASVSEAWVIDRGAGPEGFVRATSSEAMRAGHLTRPILGRGVDGSLASALMRTAISWLQRRSSASVVCEVPDDASTAVAALASEGFAPSLRMITMCRSSSV